MKKPIKISFMYLKKRQTVNYSGDNYTGARKFYLRAKRAKLKSLRSSIKL